MSKVHGLKPLTQREKDGLLKAINNSMKDCKNPKRKEILESMCNNVNVVYLTDSLVAATIYKDLYYYDDQKLGSFHESIIDGDFNGKATVSEWVKLINYISDRILLFNYKFHYTFKAGKKEEIHACLKVNATISNRCLVYEITPIVDSDNMDVYKLPVVYTKYLVDDIGDSYYYLDDFINEDISFIDNIRKNFITRLSYPIYSNIDSLVKDKNISIKDISIKLTSLDYTFKEVIKSNEVFETITEIHTDDPESLLSYDTDLDDEEASTEEEVSEVLDLNSEFECPCNSRSVIKMDSTDIKDKRTKSIVEFVKEVIPDETFLAMAVVGQDYFDDDPEGVIKTTSNTIKKIISDNIKLFDESTEFRVHRVIRITDNSYIHDFVSISYDDGEYTVTPYIYNTLTGEIDKKNQYGINDVNDFLHDIDDLVNTWAEFWHKITSNAMVITVSMIEKE